MPRLILAHDLGTSGNKATLFSEDGKLIASKISPYETVFKPGGIAEQNPDDWWQAVCQSTREVLANQDATKVAALAFSGTMMGCLCVDQSGKPLRPHMLYCDQRASKQAQRLNERAGPGEVYRISGNPSSAVNSGAKCMWVRENEPEIYRSTRVFLNAKDYLNFKLTGCLATDPTDASGTNLYDLEKWDWSEELIAAAELDRKLFPKIVPSTQPLGELTRAAAEAMGLKPGIPVMAGAADGMCAGVGAGSVAPGKTYNCIGSSAWIGITTTRPLLDPKQRTITFAHAVPGMFQPMGTMLMGGSVYAWAAEVFGQRELAELRGVNRYELMSEAASQSPAGANGLIFLPHLMGERSPRWNSLARGGFIGLGVTHNRGDMLRAVIEGVAFNLVLTLDLFREFGQDIRELVMIGGAAKGAIWRRVLSDVYNADLLRPNYLDEATSIGAAIIAGIGAGIYHDFSVVDHFLTMVDKTHPIPENVTVYQKQKALFNDVYKALEPLFPRFAGEEHLA